MRPLRVRRIGALVCLLIALPLSLSAAPAPPGQETEVLTFHDDPARTGWDPAERELTPEAVRTRTFGRLWTAPVEGEMYAEPLIASGVDVHGVPRTLVYAVTGQDLVFAFDAATGKRVWGPVSLGAPVPGDTLPCGDLDPVGITGTPVIDRASSTLYAAGLTTPDAGKTKVYILAALDLATGTPRPGWPVVIAPPASRGVHFDPQIQEQRGALTLLHGIVYVPFGGYFGDCGDYHGWVVGIPVSLPHRQQAFATPTHRMGGIWATGGVAADAAGNLYAATGNSDSFAAADLSNSVVRLSPKPTLTFSGSAHDFFTPSNFVSLNETDTDLGSSAPLVLPDQPDVAPSRLVFIAGKQGVGYLVSRDQMGGVSRGNGVTGEGVFSRCIFGTCQAGWSGSYSAAAYWDGGRTGRLILVPGRGSQPAPCHGAGGVVALRLKPAPGSGTPMYDVAWCSPSMQDPGAPAVSSTGADGGLVWAADAGTLYALDARTGTQVYASAGQDAPGRTHRFITPAVAGGRVYVGAAQAVVAYGLK
ncbi:MAG TPA: PQQ-binding-like beta-propeller repeat protein [bacterium]|nr:PQQ-binding-like beta-propeller repeat protein [bacterium]